MDGPNVNKKFLRDLILQRESSNPDISGLLDLGVCGLHVVHGAFRTGFEKTGWKIERFLRSLWYLLNESPARRQDFIEITGCTIYFPLQFCGTRWIEDINVAERAIFIWDSIEKYFEHIAAGPKVKVPKCSSFTVLQNAHNDPLTRAKLHVFISIAKIMQLFLETFQISRPMIPFLAEKLEKKS